MGMGIVIKDLRLKRFGCFMTHYDRLKDHEQIQLDTSDNCIRTEWIGMDGELYYDHTDSFHLWKIDSWEDEEYWELLQRMSGAIKCKTGSFPYGRHPVLCPKNGKGTTIKRKRDGFMAAYALRLAGLDWNVVQEPVYTGYNEMVKGYKINVRGMRQSDYCRI